MGNLDARLRYELRRLAVHALALYPRARLETELDGVDVRSELRRYSIAQLAALIALIALIAVVQALRRDRNAAK